MSAKKSWGETVRIVKRLPRCTSNDAILAADRIVRAAVALSRKAFLYANATLPDGETLVGLDRLHRAVENFEKEGER